MAQDAVNTGTGPNAGNGDPLRSAFTKINEDLTELYALVAAKANSSSPAFSGVPETPDAVGSPPGTMVANLNYVHSYVADALSGAVVDLGDLLESIQDLSVLPADRYIYTTGNDTVAAGTITAAGRAILDDADAAAQRTTLGLANVLFSDVTAALSAGFTATAYDAGTKTTGTFTPDPALGNIQRVVNNGAHTLAPPASSCSMVLKYTNDASAGTITTSGFDMVSGDAPPTTDTSVYVAYVTVIDGWSHLTWVSGDGDIDLSAYLRNDTSDNLTAGFTVSVYAAGTKSTGTFTPDPANGNMQSATNNGAHTLAPPSDSCTMIIAYTNGASAGTITTSGFTVVSGDAPGTTSGDDFLAYITKIGTFSHLTWVALQ